LKETEAIILRTQAIQRSFYMGGNELKVLKDIDLEVRTGEIVIVMGRSGAGKSTLLHILGALDRPDRGSVWISGMDVFSQRDQNLAHFRNQTVGFVFQFHHLLPEFTALENVAMPGLIARLPRKEAMERAERLLESVEMHHRLTHRPRELSGGEQQRVAFARSLVNDPLLILADEPSGNLDLKSSRLLHRLMWEMVRKKGKTLIVVTHNPELAEQGDRVITLRDGVIK